MFISGKQQLQPGEPDPVATGCWDVICVMVSIISDELSFLSLHLLHYVLHLPDGGVRLSDAGKQLGFLSHAASVPSSSRWAEGVSGSSATCAA